MGPRRRCPASPAERDRLAACVGTPRCGSAPSGSRRCSSHCRRAATMAHPSTRRRRARAPRHRPPQSPRRRPIRSHVLFQDQTTSTMSGSHCSQAPADLGGPRPGGTDKLERKVVFTVTDLEKEIDDVPAVVVWESRLHRRWASEAELSFFAQGDAGNVWHLGEYPRNRGGPDREASAVDRRSPRGTPGHPHAGQPGAGYADYAQGWGPAVGWNDRGATYAVGEHTCSDVDCYDNVLVMMEFGRPEPGAFQLKYYAPGMGTSASGGAGPTRTKTKCWPYDEHRTVGCGARSRTHATPR